MIRHVLLLVFQVPLTVIAVHVLVVMLSIGDRAAKSEALGQSWFTLFGFTVIAVVTLYVWKVILQPHLDYPQPEEERLHEIEGV